MNAVFEDPNVRIQLLARRSLAAPCGVSRSLALFAALTLLCAAALAQGDGTPASKQGIANLTIGSGSGGPGSLVEIPVMLERQNTQPATIIFRIDFDPVQLDFENVTPGPAATTANKQVQSSVVALGQVSFAIADLTGPSLPMSDGVLLTASFRVLQSVTPGEFLPLEGAVPSASTSAGTAIDINILDGEILVLDCTVPSAPTGIAATDGNFSDRVRVTWNAVAGASEYRVYRSRTDNPESAVALGPWSANTTFDDFSAEPPVQAGSGCSATSTPTRYYYWVRARNECGDGARGGPDQGHRGATRKHALAAGAPPPVLASGASGDAYLVTEDAPALTLRLEADSPIAADSVRAEFEGPAALTPTQAWHLDPNSNGEAGWLTIHLSGAAVGDRVILHFGASAATGDPIGPYSVAVHVQPALAASGAKLLGQPHAAANTVPPGAAWPEHAVDAVAQELTGLDAPPPFAEGLGAPYLAKPSAPATLPHRLWLPVPESATPDTVELYLHVPGSGWMRAHDAGILASSAALELEGEGGVYVGFLLNHGGVLQLGHPSGQGAIAAAGLAPAPPGWYLGDAAVMLLGALVLLGLGRPARRNLPGRAA